MQAQTTFDIAQGILRTWPEDDQQFKAIGGHSRRYAFSADLATAGMKPGAVVVDVGGGWGVFAAVCSAMGMRAVSIDDYEDEGFFKRDDARHQLPSKYGFSIVNRDVIRDGIDFEPSSVDVVTSFDSMEHWHASPKRLFEQVMTVLRPGGRFVLGVPNCVNLRKRITMPFGFGKWTSMQDWYESPVFRGHVREPDVQDLHYIANHMGLAGVRIVGRNWTGLFYTRKLVRVAAWLIDYPLRLRPSLCADLYLVGHKPI